MILVGEVLQRIQSAYSKGVESKDSRLTDAHIYSAATSARTTLLRQRSNSKQYINHWAYQNLNINLVPSSIHEVPNAPKGAIILRGDVPLPQLVSDMNTELVDYFMTIDGETTISPDGFGTIKYAKGNKYTAESPRFFLKNSYLYITIFKQLKTASFSGIFQDPIEVQRLCEDCECKSNYELNFFFDRDLLTPLAKIASEELVLLLAQISEDKTNNATDDTGVKGSMVHQNQG